jgi:hypothetical protein
MRCMNIGQWARGEGNMKATFIGDGLGPPYKLLYTMLCSESKNHCITCYKIFYTFMCIYLFRKGAWIFYLLVKSMLLYKNFLTSLCRL